MSFYFHRNIQVYVHFTVRYSTWSNNINTLFHLLRTLFLITCLMPLSCSSSMTAAMPLRLSLKIAKADSLGRWLMQSIESSVLAGR
jgi:hypothetical protein